MMKDRRQLKQAGKSSSISPEVVTDQQRLSIVCEGSWDAPLKPDTALHVSDNDYLLLLDPHHVASRCKHVLKKIACPCGNIMGARECSSCQAKFCGVDCPYLKRSTEDVSVKYGNAASSKDDDIKMKLKAIEDTWTRTDGGWYVPQSNREEAEMLHRYADLARISYADMGITDKNAVGKK